MVFWDALPRFEHCRLCGRKDVVFDYDLQDYHLFRYDAGTVARGDELYGHAPCLARRFGISALVKIADHQITCFFWMLKESGFGLEGKRDPNGPLRRMLLRALAQLMRAGKRAS
ncbi:MAG TPA: hypothetical protein VG457_00475 [Planctomycetota bacterium]|jgi:hypothetical protein|nr:hypothetical protein [Planctomycetota bacterium]